jgi:hypothetical protein
VECFSDLGEQKWDFMWFMHGNLRVTSLHSATSERNFPGKVPFRWVTSWHLWKWRWKRTRWKLMAVTMKIFFSRTIYLLYWSNSPSLGRYKSVKIHFGSLLPTASQMMTSNRAHTKLFTTSFDWSFSFPGSLLCNLRGHLISTIIVCRREKQTASMFTMISV